MNKKQVTHEIEFYGLKIEVAGCYYKGSFETREQPADPQEFEIDAVYLNDENITELLENSDDKLEELERKILEKHYS